MNQIELVLLLLFVTTALTPAARKLHIPYPILLVLGGLVLALIPVVPDFPLEPELIFLVFLPPLVFRAAFTTSVRDLRAVLQPVLSLAVGLVLATMLVLAVVLHAFMPELGWPVAFAFGAIVSPPDALAAVAVLRGLGVPRKILTLLEGESLINDATALVAYRAALTAAVVAFSASESSVRVVFVGIGGVLVGLAVAAGAGWLLKRIDDPAVDVTLTLLTPFAAYLPAESFGLSGVLAAVAAGLYLGARSSYIMRSDTRLRAWAVWDMVDYILNGLVFILIGLQLSVVLPGLMGRSILSLIGLGLLLSLTAIVVRMVWVFLDAYLRWWLWRLGLFSYTRSGRRIKRHKPNPREKLVVGWAGMRGVVSLAAVLTLPQATPERNVVIFLTFFVILTTLVGQGLTLPLLIHRLGITVDSSIAAEQELLARRTATEAAISRIEQLREEWPSHLPLIETLRVQYDHRASHFGANGNSGDGDTPGDDTPGNNGQASPEEVDQELLEHHLIRRAVLGAERSAVLDLRERGEIDDDIWRQIERDLDLEELRMDA